MKKAGRVLLSAALAFSMAGCKSEETKAVEAAIEAIDIENLSLDQWQTVEDAKSAYEALEEKDAKKVENYAKLEEADKKLDDIYVEGADYCSEMLEEADQKMDAFDADGAYMLLENALPIAKSLSESPYHERLDYNPQEVIKQTMETLEAACYTGTHIITLNNYIKLAKISNATASSSNEGESYNVDDETGMHYLTYMYNRSSQLVNAFDAYTDYFDSIMTVEDIKREDTKFIYRYKDQQGLEYQLVAWIISLGDYGTYYWLMVYMDPSIPLPKK